MKRNILLVEPGYKTKFPPLGLMKISTYHKELGDSVHFVKGIDKGFVLDNFWDRIYISTVFTFNWDVTVKTIKYYKKIVRGDVSKIFVGGILASLMPKELWTETGVMPVVGLLNKPGPLDKDNNRIIDSLIPDYDLFKDSKAEYTLINDTYFGYTTRGCPNKCKFCGVNTLEPKFIDYKGIKTYINSIKSFYGEKPHLVLFDNNILASKRFDKIIEDLIELGFEKNARFTYRNKIGAIAYKNRYVDFNQGVDVRYLDEEKFKSLSRISLNPLRIAFDSIRMKDDYCDRIRLAAKYDIRHLSNYILYNYKDTPEELWQRLKINIELNKQYELRIYSFPMKYMPLDCRDRSHISKHWNWQYLRGVQRILNVVKGIVMAGEEFFSRAFGESEEEFVEILQMPERILMNRSKKPLADEKNWKKQFRELSPNEQKELLDVLCNNPKKQKLINAVPKLNNGKLKSILEYYLPEEKSDDSTQLKN